MKLYNRNEDEIIERMNKQINGKAPKYNKESIVPHGKAKLPKIKGKAVLLPEHPKPRLSPMILKAEKPQYETPNKTYNTITSEEIIIRIEETYNRLKPTKTQSTKRIITVPLKEIKEAVKKQPNKRLEEIIKETAMEKTGLKNKPEIYNPYKNYEEFKTTTSKRGILLVGIYFSN